MGPSSLGNPERGREKSSVGAGEDREANPRLPGEGKGHTKLWAGSEQQRGTLTLPGGPMGLPDSSGV